MNIWDWVADYQKKAQADGDKQRLRLTEIFPAAWPHRETAPERMLQMFREGRWLAQQLDEPWWMLFFDYWQVGTLMYWMRDFRDVNDLAISAMLKARSLAFAGCPLNVAIHRDLTNYYLAVDALGYEERIRELINFIEREFAIEGEDRYLLLGDKCTLAQELEHWDEAENFALHELSLVDGDDPRNNPVHHAIFTYTWLCWIAYQRQSWNELSQWARVGEDRSHKAGYGEQEAEFLAWQALLARRERDEEGAQRLKRRASSRISRLRLAWSPCYWFALSAFHKVGGELERSLRVWQRAMGSIAGHGRLALECDYRLEQCRVLAKLGRLGDDDVAAASASAARLLKPAIALGKLERILRGDEDEE
jgi:hypothetical protein